MPRARANARRESEANASTSAQRDGRAHATARESGGREHERDDRACVSEIQRAWEAVQRGRTSTERVVGFHALASAIEGVERGFEDARGAEASAHRAGRNALKKIDELPLHGRWIDCVVSYAVGYRMFTCELREQAGAMRVLRACGLGRRLRGQPNDILGEDDSQRSVYANVLSELAFEERSYERAVEGRRADERLAGPTFELDARRLKTYAMGALASLLVTDDGGATGEHIKNGVMEALLKPLVSLICKNGQGVPDWEVDATNSIELARAAGDECESGLAAGDCENIHRALMQGRLMCVGGIGDYVECFAEALQHGVLELSLRLIAGPGEQGWPVEFGTARRFESSVRFPGDPQLPEALAVVSAFLAHRKFAISFIELGGAKMMLNVPRGPMSFYNLTRCMFGIASITTALERLVSPSIDLSRRYVKMALELLDCSNEYARRHAALFLTFAVQIPIVVVAFDAEAGLKLILNTLRTMALIISDEERMRDRMSVQEIAMAKETGDHVSLLLRQYMRAHFAQHIKAIEEKVLGKSKKNETVPMSKNAKLSEERASKRAMFQAMDIGQDAVDRLFSLVSRQKRIAAVMQTKKWLVVEAFIAQGGPKVMLDLLTLAPGEKSLRECVLGSLSVLKIVTSHPSGRVATAKVQFDEHYSSSYVLMDVVESAAEAVDTEAVVEALKVVCNLVIPPSVLYASEQKAKDKSVAAEGATLQRVQSVEGKSFSVFDYARMEETFDVGRKSVQEASGVKALLKLLFKSSKALPQPSMNISRALCCRALLGLSRDSKIASTLQTLQIARLLSELVRETGTARSSALDPEGDLIVDSKRESGTGSAATVQAAAAEFHRCAVELIAATAGFANVKATTPAVASDAAAPPLAKLERHLIAASTKVRYPHEELLQIMHEHLVAAGLTNTASALLEEARLARPDSGANVLRSGDSPAPRLKLNFKNKQATSKMRRRAPRSKMTGAARGIIGKVDEPFILGLDRGPQETLLRELSGAARNVTDRSLTPTPAPRGVKRMHPGEDLRKSVMSPALPNMDGCCAHDHLTPSPGVKEKFHKEFPTPGMLVAEAPRGETGCGVRSRLDSILTQYLRAQHRQCAAPITACAPFSLLTPHQCPQPKRPLEAPRNLTSRLRQREWANTDGWGIGMSRADRHFVYSRFRPLRVIRSEDSLFSAASYVHGIIDQVVVGTNDGEIQVFDTITGDMLEAADALRYGSVRKIVPTGSKCPTPVFAVSSAQGVSLWKLASSEEAPEMLWGKDTGFGIGITVDSSGSTFASGAVDTNVEIMDLETQSLLRTLQWKSEGPPAVSNFGDVSFSPNDSLLLWDETLWDLRIGNESPIHRFDRFSETAGACFHPGGNEIIIGREVWDIRSSRLLRTVPSLNRASLNFNRSGTVGLAHIMHPRNEELLWSLRKCHHPYKHSFCTIDAADYSDICTVDVTYGMIDACWDVNSDTVCATVEYDILDSHESVVRIHEVGRLRMREDESDIEEDPHDPTLAGVLDIGSMDLDEDWSDEEWEDEEAVDADGRRTINESRVARQIASLREIAGLNSWEYEDAPTDDTSEYDSDFIDSDEDSEESDVYSEYSDDGRTRVVRVGPNTLAAMLARPAAPRRNDGGPHARRREERPGRHDARDEDDSQNEDDDDDDDDDDEWTTDDGEEDGDDEEDEDEDEDDEDWETDDEQIADEA